MNAWRPFSSPVTALGHSRLSGPGPFVDHFSMAQTLALIASTAAAAKLPVKHVANWMGQVLDPELPSGGKAILRS